MHVPHRLSRLLLTSTAVSLFILGVYWGQTVHADELDEINQQIQQKQQEYLQTEGKLKSAQDSQKNLSDLLGSLKGKLGATAAQMGQVNTQVAAVQAQLKEVEDKLTQRQVELSRNEDVRNQTVRNYYVRRQVTPLELVLAGNADDSMKNFIFQQSALDKLRNTIENLNTDITHFQDQKNQVAKIKTDLDTSLNQLASLKGQLSNQTTSTSNQINQVEKQKGDLENELKSITDALSSLSTKQQSLITAKSGAFTTSVGDVPLADDPNASPTFNPGFSPAFAAFSFGAYSHRNGMSQYGALGRANAGHTAEQILAKYYPAATLNKSYALPATIAVQGYGEMPFDDQYMNRIYEMPSDWPMEALKAQAVAARTYALRSSKPICTDEACQVYKDSDKADRWKQAVKETRGWVLEGGPSPQYSSTTGGYLNNSGWDTTSGDRTSWTAGAFEKLAGSPWFYKGWYTQGYAITSGGCGKASPWLTNDEFADIINAYLVLGNGAVDQGRIAPVTTGCWPGNPYSMAELRDMATQHGGGAITSVSSVAITYSNQGSTGSVVVFTNRGSLTIDGANFKSVFNLRAPGYISIRSPLFNIEKK